MLKIRGFTFVLKYFVNAHLFDLVHRVDTHRWFKKYQNGKEVKLKNYKHGVLYMPTWTCVINAAFKILTSHENLKSYTFIDVGCGKGKVLIQWFRLINKQSIHMDLIGVEYDKYLAEICKRNLLTLKMDEKVKILNMDITNVKFNQLGSKFIFFLYHPFDESILRKFLEMIKSFEYYLIYVNPYQTKYFDNSHEKISIYRGKNSHENYVIFKHMNKLEVVS
jgi:16S rRNA G966 N2-methylase RsmD